MTSREACSRVSPSGTSNGVVKSATPLPPGLVLPAESSRGFVTRGILGHHLPHLPVQGGRLTLGQRLVELVVVLLGQDLSEPVSEQARAKPTR